MQSIDTTTHRAMNTMRAFGIAMLGAPGFFAPRFPSPQLFPSADPASLSYYDVGPLKKTLERLVDFDRINLGGNVSKAAVAKAVKLQPRTLHRKLAAEGTSYRQLLDMVCGEMGRRRIENTSLSLSTIASQLGYADLAAFSRHFRALFGASPRTWRRQRTTMPPAIDR